MTPSAVNVLALSIDHDRLTPVVAGSTVPPLSAQQRLGPADDRCRALPATSHRPVAVGATDVVAGSARRALATSQHVERDTPRGAESQRRQE